MSKTQLEKSLEYIIDVFHEYAAETSPPDKLSKGEFAKMVKEQLPNVMRSSKNPQDINRLFNEMDQNKDGQLGLGKYLTALFTIFRTSVARPEPAV